MTSGLQSFSGLRFSGLRSAPPENDALFVAVDPVH